MWLYALVMKRLTLKRPEYQKIYPISLVYKPKIGNLAFDVSLESAIYLIISKNITIQLGSNNTTWIASVSCDHAPIWDKLHPTSL